MNYSTSWAPQALPLSWVTSYAESRDLPSWGRLPSGPAPSQPGFTLADKSIIIVYNPRAGNGQGEIKAQAFRNALEERGQSVLLLETSPDYATTKTKVSTALEFSPTDTVVLAISGDGPTGPVADAVYHSKNGIFLPVGGGTTNDLAKFGGTQFGKIGNLKALRAFLNQTFHIQGRHLTFLSTDNGPKQAVPHTFAWGEAPELFRAVDDAARNAERPKRKIDYILRYLAPPPEGSHYHSNRYRFFGLPLPLGLSAYIWGGMKDVTIDINGQASHTHATEIVMPIVPLVGGALGVPGGINPAHGQTNIGALPKNPFRYLGVFGDGNLRAILSHLFPNLALGSGSSNPSLCKNQSFPIGPGDHFKIIATPTESRGLNPPTLLNGDPQNNSPSFVEGKVSHNPSFRTLVTSSSKAYRLTAGANQSNLFIASGALGASLFPAAINLALFSGLGFLKDLTPDELDPAITYGGALLGNGLFAGASAWFQKRSFSENFWSHLNPLRGGIKSFAINYIWGTLEAKGWELGYKTLFGENKSQSGETAFTTLMTTYTPMYQVALQKALRMGFSLSTRASLFSMGLRYAPAIFAMTVGASSLFERNIA